jgi:rubrerythrin
MQYADLDDQAYSYQLDIDLLQTMGKPISHDEGVRFLQLKTDLQQTMIEYKGLTDSIIDSTIHYDILSQKLLKVKRIMNELDPSPLFGEQLETLISTFRKEEKIDELEAALKDIDKKRAEYKSIFRILKDVETHNIYCCFLCLERNVTIFIDPCGHLMCETCEKKLGGSSCPFCRSSVKLFKKMFLT